MIHKVIIILIILRWLNLDQFLQRLSQIYKLTLTLIQEKILKRFFIIDFLMKLYTFKFLVQN